MSKMQTSVRRIKQATEQLPIYDAVAERMVITALLEHGAKVYYDIDGLVQDKDLYMPENKIIFSAIRQLIVDNKLERPDVTSIVGIIRTNDPKALVDHDITDYITALGQEVIPAENVGPFCQRVVKLSLVRNLRARLLQAANGLGELNGDESAQEIIAAAEKPIIEFSNSLVSTNETIKLGTKLVDYLNMLAESKPGPRGIPTGFPRYDQCIGGGLRPGVHLIGARAGVGKSFMCLNIAHNVMNLGIPVLYLDTELTEEAVMDRLSALISGVKIDDISTGLFSQKADSCQKVFESAKKFADNNLFYYENISGKNHNAWISIMRRWIMKDVGFKPDGTVKDCVILLDYIKTMDLRELKNVTEWQYLGQAITDLHNFTVTYDVPILSMAQLNRDGIHKDDQSVIAASDRLIALCSSFSILRKKEQEDFADDPPYNGNMRIGNYKSRFGASLADGEYINIKADLSISKMEEGKTNLENRQTKNNNLVLTNDPNGDSKITI
jgi:replicative DNA helicase